MRETEPATASANKPEGLFVTTRWSVVLTARDQSSTEAKEALETLCQTYWYPIYAFVRRQGRKHHDAED